MVEQQAQQSEDQVWNLSEFVTALSWENLPEDVRLAAPYYFLDAMATSIYGALQPKPRAVAKWVKKQFASGPAHLLSESDGSGVSPSGAAFANTFAGRANTFDDTHEGAVIHPGVPLLMTGLAVAEKTKASGAEFLAAVVAGYDVAIRLAEAVMPSHYDRGHHTTGTFNTLGTAAVAAKLYGLSAADLFGSINLAAEHAAGLRQYQIDGDIVQSALHGARAAQLGCESAELVSVARLPYSPGGVSGKMGLWATLGDSVNRDSVLSGLGHDFRMIETGIKLYPSCRYVHGAVDAVLQCVSHHGLKTEDIKKIEIETFDMAAEEGNRPQLNSVTDAQFSIQYNVSLALEKGSMSPADFTPSAIQRFAAFPLGDKISVIEDTELSKRYPKQWPYRAKLRTKGGKEFAFEVSNPVGASDNPLGPDAIREKAQRLLKEAGDGFESVVDDCVEIATVEDMSSFVQSILHTLHVRRL